MQLWSQVGGRIGFAHIGGPFPRSSPEVASQLANVYRSSLLDFEEHWYQALRPEDPTALLPLPKHLQDLHPGIEKLAVMSVAVSQLPLEHRHQAVRQSRHSTTLSQTATHGQHDVQSQQAAFSTQPMGADAPNLRLRHQFQLQAQERHRHINMIRQQPQLLRVPAGELRKMGWGEQEVRLL